MPGLQSRSEKAAAIEDIALRTLITAKIHDGRLPRTALPHVWGGPGHGATCSACEDTLSKRQLEIEAVLMDERKAAQDAERPTVVPSSRLG